MALSRSSSRRGQAALEFLMTYGWALVVVLVAIGALTYFTGFYAKITPPVCAIGAPFTCLEHKAMSDGTLLLGIQNSAGWDTTNVNISVLCNQDPAQERSYTQGLVRNQERMNGTFVRFDCPIDGMAFKAKISIIYAETGQTVTHTVAGDIRTTVE